MNIIYYKDEVGNFGDDLNEWLWSEISPNIKKKKSEYSLLGVGSIISTEIIKNRKVIVFGSGIAYGKIPDKKNMIIKCVRGKLSAKMLGINESLAIADSAILIRDIPRFSPINEKNRAGKILIPHHITFNKYNSDLLEVCKRANIELIDPSKSSEYVINKIRNAKLVITEAMHGGIIADTLRVKWIPIVLSSNISTFKWLDWLSMFNISYKPIYIGVPNPFDYYVDKFLIKNRMANFKENYLNMDEKDIFFIKDRNTYFFKKYKKILKIIKPFLKSEKRIKQIVKQLESFTEKNSYLSDNHIFNKNLELLKIKLNELERDCI